MILLDSEEQDSKLFTADGILNRETEKRLRGKTKNPSYWIWLAYRDWLRTQESDYAAEQEKKEEHSSRLMDIPELYARRAPGNTCLSALRGRKEFGPDCFIHPINNSKGCGGIMRTSPVALAYIPGGFFSGTVEGLDIEAARSAAITHGHPLGYMPAAVLNHVISRILTSAQEMTLKEIVIQARDAVSELFPEDIHLRELNRIIDKAVELSETEGTDDLSSIHELGEGWVAEETLGIALYCSLKYPDDFSKAVITAVNHNGDSDSTGAVTGNIVGALVGYEGIEDKWKQDLELKDLLLKTAEELYRGHRIEE